MRARHRRTNDAAVLQLVNEIAVELSIVEGGEDLKACVASGEPIAVIYLLVALF